jgi:hypothetical protein
MAKGGWKGVSDTGEPGTSREDVEGHGKVGFAAITTEGDEVVVSFALMAFEA